MYFPRPELINSAQIRYKQLTKLLHVWNPTLINTMWVNFELLKKHVLLI